MSKFIITYKVPMIIHVDEDDSDEDYVPTVISDKDRIELAGRTADDFNNDDVGQYINDHLSTDIVFKAYNTGEDFLIQATTDNNNPEFIESVRDEIEGQCSDGWGEGFEQFPQEIDGVEFYISTWGYDDDEKILFIGCVEES